MAIPTLLANFEGSLTAETRDDPETFTSYGPVRYVQGAAPGSQAYVAEEGTTNLVLNPLAMNGTANVNRISPGDSIEVIDDTHIGFGKTFRLTNSGEDSGGGMRVFTDTGLGGTERTFTLTAYARADAGKTIGIRLRASYDDDSVDYPAFPSVIAATGDWQAIELTGTTTAGKTLNDLSLYAYIQTDGTASWIDVHAVQIEEKPYATSFCPQLDESGSLKAGYTWAGTAHASASTRANTRLTLSSAAPAIINHFEGSIVVRFVPYLDRPSTAGRLFEVGDVGDGAYISCYQASTADGRATYHTRTDGTNTAIATLDLPPLGEWATWVLSWDEDEITAHNENGLIGRADRTGQPLDVWAEDTIKIGGTFDIDGLALFGRQLTSAERQRLMTAPTWEWDMLVPRFGGIHVSAPIEPIAVAVTAGEDW